MQPVFGAALRRDASGASWLPRLLALAPRGRQALGSLVDAPGTLSATTIELSASKKAGVRCFEVQVPPDRRLLAWCVENPGRLIAPPPANPSSATVTARRKLLRDDPPGSRPGAQEEARRAVANSSVNQRAWWRFERATEVDCVLATDRMVLCIEGKRTEKLSANTEWLAGRDQVTRNLEAARRLAGVGRRFGVLVCVEKSGDPLADPRAVEAGIEVASPHLFAAERCELVDHYLGELTWRSVCEALDVSFDALPDTVSSAAAEPI